MAEVTLQFLGGTVVRRGTAQVTGRAVQRRRIALLGLLAASPGGSISRDRVIGLLWPEADTTAARDGLNTAVYDLRVALGEGAIRSIGDDLALDADAVDADVTGFEASVASGDAAGAVALYRGPFLDGLFVSGAPEFERWLETTRERLRRQYRSALERQAAAAGEREAIELHVRLALDDIANGSAVRDAMRRLLAARDTAGALRLAEQHAKAAADVGPDAGVVAEMQRIRADQAPGPGRRWSWPTRHVVMPLVRPRVAAAVAGSLALAAALFGFRAYAGSVGGHVRAGEHDYRAGRYLAAVEHFRAAVQRDSAHAMAWYRLSQAIIAADLPESEAESAETHAQRLSGALTERERLLMRGYAAFRGAHPNKALEVYRGLVALYPDDAEAWYQLGETLFHYNPRRGRSILEAREAFTRAAALDPVHWGARWHLAHLTAAAGDRRGFDSSLAMLLEGSPETSVELELATLRALASGDSAAERRLLPQLAATDHLRLFQIAWRSAVFLQDLTAADRVARLLAQGPETAHLLGRSMLAYISMARGRWDEAQRQLGAGGAAEPNSIVETRLVVAVHPLAPHRGRLLDSLVAALERLPPTAEGAELRTRLAGYLAAERGDGHAVAALGRQLDSLGGQRYSNALRGRLAFGRGRWLEASAWSVSGADTVPWFGWAVTSPAQAGTLERWVHAEALRELGHDSAALAWYGTFGEHALPDIALWAPARLRRGEILERLGRPSEARREYEGFVELWRDADAELQPLVADARRRIERLSRLLRAE